VEAALTMKEAIAAVEEAFRQQALGNVIMPLRTTIRIASYKGVNLAMPAYIGGDMDGLGVKIVSVYADNPAKFNLPAVIATVILNDPRTGAPIAIMDGTHLTAMRTGAVSGVATKYLARPEAKTVALFGAGVQARTQVMALCEVRKIEKVFVYDVVPAARERYCQEMGKRLGVEMVPVDNPRPAVEQADLIVAASTSKTPLFDGRWLKEGTHINGVGSHSPDARELDEQTIKVSKVVVDLREAALAEAGDVIIPINAGVISKEHIHADLGEIVSGKKAARTDPKEITVFKSVGLALQDVSTATRVYQLAKAKGLGVNFDF